MQANSINCSYQPFQFGILLPQPLRKSSLSLWQLTLELTSQPSRHSSDPSDLFLPLNGFYFYHLSQPSQSFFHGFVLFLQFFQCGVGVDMQANSINCSLQLSQFGILLLHPPLTFSLSMWQLFLELSHRLSQQSAHQSPQCTMKLFRSRQFFRCHYFVCSMIQVNMPVKSSCQADHLFRNSFFVPLKGFCFFRSSQMGQLFFHGFFLFLQFFQCGIRFDMQANSINCSYQPFQFGILLPQPLRKSSLSLWQLTLELTSQPSRHSSDPSDLFLPLNGFYFYHLSQPSQSFFHGFVLFLQFFQCGVGVDMQANSINCSLQLPQFGILLRHPPLTFSLGMWQLFLKLSHRLSRQSVHQFSQCSMKLFHSCYFLPCYYFFFFSQCSMIQVNMHVKSSCQTDHLFRSLFLLFFQDSHGGSDQFVPLRGFYFFCSSQMSQLFFHCLFLFLQFFQCGIRVSMQANSINCSLQASQFGILLLKALLKVSLSLWHSIAQPSRHSFDVRVDTQANSINCSLQPSQFEFLLLHPPLTCSLGVWQLFLKLSHRLSQHSVHHFSQRAMKLFHSCHFFRNYYFFSFSQCSMTHVNMHVNSSQMSQLFFHCLFLFLQFVQCGIRVDMQANSTNCKLQASQFGILLLNALLTLSLNLWHSVVQPSRHRFDPSDQVFPPTGFCFVHLSQMC